MFVNSKSLINNFDQISSNMSPKKEAKENLIRMSTVVTIIERTLLNPDYNFDFQLFYMKCYELCQERLYGWLTSEIMRIVGKLCGMLNSTLKSSSLLLDLVNLTALYDTSTTKIAHSLIYVEKKMKLSNPSFIFINNFQEIFFFELLSKWTNHDLILQVNHALTAFRQKNQSPKVLQEFLNLISQTNTFILASEVEFSEQSGRKLDSLAKSISLAKGEDIELKKVEMMQSIRSFRAFFDELLTEIRSSTEKYYSLFYKSYQVVNNFCNYQGYINKVEEILELESTVFVSISKACNPDEGIINIIIRNLLISDMDFVSEFLLTEIMKSVTNPMKPDTYKVANALYKLFTKDESVKALLISKINSIIVKYLEDSQKKLDASYEYEKNKSREEPIPTEKNRELRNLVSSIVEKKKHLQKFIDSALCKDQRIEQIVKSFFEKMINGNNGFLLKKYIFFIHEEIKVSIKTSKFSFISEISDEFLIVYKLFQDKDLFEKEYRDKLSKRLLRNSLYIKETEFPLIEILRRESGKNFTKKIETMIQDIWVSRQLSLDYSSKTLLSSKSTSRVPSRHVSKINQVNVNSTAGLISNLSPTYPQLNVFQNKRIEFNIKVLDQESWPLEASSKFSMPSELDGLVSDFSEFYCLKNKGRNLTMLNEHSWAELNAKFQGKKYVLIVSGIQLSILYQFNLKNTLTVIRIREDINLSLVKFKKEEQLSKDKLALKFIEEELDLLVVEQILIKTSNEYSVNRGFISQSYKIVLNKKKSYECLLDKLEEKDICPMIIEDRKYKVDASIMKSIKLKKIIDFSSLFLEVMQSLSKYFALDSVLMKSRIENLIDRNLITRDLDNNDLFKYAS